MNSNDSQSIWLTDMTETVASYRSMIDATVAQLTDDELFARPQTGFNSAAILLRHLGGNLYSRWTDFLTTDGEKPDRARDVEFEDWDGDRAALLAYFDRGWKALTAAIDQINGSNIDRTILIRGEPHSIPLALMRSITHVSYHVGQITMVARMVHTGPWDWLTIAPGKSAEHNSRTWGTTAARGAQGDRTA